MSEQVTVNPHVDLFYRFYELFAALVKQYYTDLTLINEPDLIEQQAHRIAVPFAHVILNEHSVGDIDTGDENIERIFMRLVFWNGELLVERPAQFGLEPVRETFAFVRDPNKVLLHNSEFATILRRLLSICYHVADDDGNPKQEAHHELVDHIIDSITDTRAGTVLLFCRRQLLVQPMGNYAQAVLQQ